MLALQPDLDSLVLVALALLVEHLAAVGACVAVRVLVLALHVCLEVALRLERRVRAVRAHVALLVVVRRLRERRYRIEMRLRD
jgi:hypothetical protein